MCIWNCPYCTNSMNKLELINLIESLKLPKDEYYILSTGALVLYGLKEKARDLDLCISKELFEDLKLKFGIKEEDKNECGFYKLNDLVEVVVNDKKDFVRDFKDDFPVQNLQNLLEFKRTMNRAKDQEDIVRIEEYLKK